MDVVGWYVLYQKYNHKDGIQNQNFGNIPLWSVTALIILAVTIGRTQVGECLIMKKENGTSQRAIVSLEKRKKRAQVIFFCSG